MPISHEREVIFIHIPKTAGQSIEQALGVWKTGHPRETLWGAHQERITLQHLTGQEIKKIVGNLIWSSYFKFAVVRNPWSKAVSEYDWYLRYGPQVSFKEWARSLRLRLAINRVIVMMEVGHNIPQSAFLFDEEGKLMVDEVLRFENIAEEFAALAKQQKWDVKLPHAQGTKSRRFGKDFREIYDTETIEIIENIYAHDIRNFGYSKNQTFG